MNEIHLDHLKDRHIEALMRIAKTRGRAFFAHPRAMMALRAEHEKRRGIVAQPKRKKK